MSELAHFASDKRSKQRRTGSLKSDPPLNTYRVGTLAWTQQQPQQCHETCCSSACLHAVTLITRHSSWTSACFHPQPLDINTGFQWIREATPTATWQPAYLLF